MHLKDKKNMITKFIKQLFAPKGSTKPASRESKKKLRVADKIVSHKAHAYPVKKHGINPKYISEAAVMVAHID